MILDSGTVFICRLDNVAENGRKPVMKLTKIKKYWYGERTIGYNRQYLAKGVNEQVDLLVRIPHDRGVRIGMYAMLGNGEQFIIDSVSMIRDDDTQLRFTDLTLRRLEKLYDVAE